MRPVILVAMLLSTACSTPPTPRPPRADEPALTVLSYNVNYGLARGGFADDETLSAIEGVDADVILLQETTADWEVALRDALGRRYPHMHFHHCCGAGGLAVLSKTKLVEVEILPEVSWFPAGRVVVETRLGRVQMLNVHLRPPFDDNGSIVSGYFTTPKIRLDEIEKFSVALDDKLPTIVVGDFNEDRGDAVKHLLQRGFVDAVPRFVPSAHTWRWKVASIDLKGRLDHFLHDEKLEAIDVKVLDAGNSDHLPIVAVLVRP